MRRGEIERLKPEYRLALSRNGKALVQCEPCSSWKCERVNRLTMA